jgi:hypothetical protein
MKALRKLAGRVGVGLAAAWLTILTPGQERPEAPLPVRNFVTEAERTLAQTLNVEALLEPGQKELVSVMRKDERAPRSWQLEPSLAREMNDAELFRFVVSRARIYLTCSAALLSRYPLEEIDEVAARNADLFIRDWASKSSGSVWISQDGMYLTDRAGKPIRLRTSEDLKNYWNLDKPFGPLIAPILEKRSWKTDTFQKNLAHLKEQYGSGLREDPEAAEALALGSGGKVYRAHLLNLTALVRYVGGQSKLVFLAPLSR